MLVFAGSISVFRVLHHHLYHFLSSLLVRFHIFLSSMKHRTVASYHFISVCFSEGCPRILVTSSKGIKRSCLKIGDPNGSKLKHSMFLYLFLYRANAVLTSGFASLQNKYHPAMEHDRFLDDFPINIFISGISLLFPLIPG